MERNPAVIIELKRVLKMTEMLEGCEKALAQIEEKHYIDDLVEDGYGILSNMESASAGKTAA
jgi:hypothetical protein